jgi:dTDP-glucose pyrophosphorylase
MYVRREEPMVQKSILESITIDRNLSFRDALAKLHATGQQILLVLDTDKRLCGVVTDGDFRRFILKNQSLDLSVAEIMNTEFMSLPQKEIGKAQRILQGNPINHLPILDYHGRVVDLVSSLDFVKGRPEYRTIPVVIMAGGKGSRLNPLTKIIPKPLMPVGDKTMIELIMDNFSTNGLCEFYIVVNYKKELIKSYFIENKLEYKVHFVEEKEYRGTAGGLSLLESSIESTFVVTNCDIIAKLDYGKMLDWHFEHDAELTILGIRKRVDIPYGVIGINHEHYVTDIDEKPYYNFMIVSGIYILEPSVFELVSRDESHDMDKLIEDCLERGKKITCYPVEGGWFDMGQFEEYKQLLKHLGVLNV